MNDLLWQHTFDIETICKQTGESEEREREREREREKVDSVAMTQVKVEHETRGTEIENHEKKGQRDNLPVEVD